MYIKPIVFVTTEEGCFIPLSHKLNHDGYFRKRWGNTLEMFHRFIWRAKKGEIPEGYEINHLCGNRACQNIDHLECITGHEHAVKTNKERYSHLKKDEAFKSWKDTGCSAATLSRTYGWSAYRWVREWKNNDK
jgi:hypothetical protein